MASPLSRLLMEFKLEGTEAAEPLPPPQVQNVHVQPVIEDKVDVARQIEERIRKEMRAAAERDLDAALAAERARYEERLIAERQKWTQEHAETLAFQFMSAFDNLEKTIFDSVGRVLAPIIADTIRLQAIEELSATLKLLLADRECGVLRISGPEDLLRELMPRLGMHAESIEYVASDEPDVSVYANGTIIETQLNVWASRIFEAVQSGQ